MLKEHYPSQGGCEAGAIETGGTPGDKEAMPATMTADASDSADNAAAQAANAAAHGRPAVSATPDNVEGSIEPGNPTAAEGALPIAEYPHAGPPARTWSSGSGEGMI